MLKYLTRATQRYQWTKFQMYLLLSFYFLLSDFCFKEPYQFFDLKLGNLVYLLRVSEQRNFILGAAQNSQIWTNL